MVYDVAENASGALLQSLTLASARDLIPSSWLLTYECCECGQLCKLLSSQHNLILRIMVEIKRVKALSILQHCLSCKLESLITPACLVHTLVLVHLFSASSVNVHTYARQFYCTIQIGWSERFPSLLQPPLYCDSYFVLRLLVCVVAPTFLSWLLLLYCGS
jgi:hypothetical protein